eukprot:4622498-Lingulodinium_polyedra.AAC.1
MCIVRVVPNATTVDSTYTADAFVYSIDPEREVMKIAYPVLLFGRNITDGRAMICSVWKRRSL